MDIKQVWNQLTAIKKSTVELTEWEKSFVQGISERVEKYGETTLISDKQAAVIDKIFSKASDEKSDKPVQKFEQAASPFPTANPFPTATAA
jgi:hypothetical protein